MNLESTTATKKLSVESRINLPRACVIGLAVGIVGSLILFRSLLGQDVSTTLWADNYDARLLHWIAGWGYKVIVENGDPLNFWNAPSFYPHSGTLAYSDSLLSAQFFYIPLRLLGLSSFGALYGTLACVSIIACLLSAIALRRIGGFSTLEIALIVFVCHFGLSISGCFAHYQVFGFQLAFPFLLFWYLLLKEWKGRYLIGASLCYAFGVGFAAYLAPILLLIAVLTAAPVLWKLGREKTLLSSAYKIGIKSCIATACIALVLVTVQIAPYLGAQRYEHPQALDESALYSAHLASLLAPPFGGNSYWYQPRGAPTRFGDTERAFFPGFLISYTMVSFLFLWAAHKFRWYGAHDRLAPGIDAHFLTYLAGLLFFSFMLACGPYPAHHPEFKFPFYYLTWIVPGLSQVRAPGRFGIFIGLPAIVFSICLLRTFFQHRKHNWVVAVFAFAVVVETWPRFETFRFHSDSDGIYKQLQTIMPPNTPVLELPVAGGDALKTILRVTDQLHGTLIHNGKIVVGYGAATSAEAEALNKLDLRIQRRKTRPAAALEFADRLSINYFVIRLNRYVPQVRNKWIKLAQENKSLETLFLDSNVLVMRRKS